MAGAATTVVVVAAGLWLLSRALNVLLSPEQLTDFANYALDREYDGRHRVRLDDVDVDLLARSAVASGVRVELAPDAASGPGPEAVIVVDSLVVRHVSPLSLILGREFRADVVRVVRPRVDLRWPADTAAPDTSSAPDSSAPTHRRDARSLMEEVAGRFPSAGVNRFDLVDGSVLLTNAEGFALGAGQINLAMTEVHLDSSEIDRADGALFSDRLEFSAREIHHTPARGGYEMRAAQLALSSAESTFTVTGIDIDTAAYDAIDGVQTRSDRFRLDLETLTLSGVDYRGVFAGPRIVVRSVRVDSAGLEVYSDKRLPGGPPTRATLPHELIRALPVPLRIDTVSLERTRIEYAERVPGSTRPGRLVFGDVWVTAVSVTNDSTHMRGDSSMIINANGILAGESRLTAVLYLDLMAPAFDLRYRGHVGAFDVPAINTMLVDLQGVRVSRGRVDSLWFDAAIRDGIARGELTAVYRDLSVEMVDRASRDPDLWDEIESLVANTFVIRGQNAVGQEGGLRVGAIEYSIKPQDTFFGRIWFGLRGGLLSLLRG